MVSTYQRPKADDQSDVRVGWDIGGVNTKAVSRPCAASAASVPFEIQRDPGALPATLAAAGAKARRSDERPHAVTMTAELSQTFRTKREGLAVVLEAVAAAPSRAIQSWCTRSTVASSHRPRPDARPLEVAASNWAATAALVARLAPDAILIDIGTDIDRHHPDRRAARWPARGRTDPARLSTGELVYTGAVRTPAEALVRDGAALGGTRRRLGRGIRDSSETRIVWLGQLDAEDYAAPPPDGRPADPRVRRRAPGPGGLRVTATCWTTRRSSEIAGALVEAQSSWSSAGHRRGARGVSPTDHHGGGARGSATSSPTDAARRAGLEVVPLTDRLGNAAAPRGTGRRGRLAPGARTQWTGERDHASWSRSAEDSTASRERSMPSVGAVGRRPAASRSSVVPGGGPFADAVRAFDHGRSQLSDDAAHWMAHPGDGPVRPRAGGADRAARRWWRSRAAIAAAVDAGRRRRARALPLDARGGRAATHVGCHQRQRRARSWPGRWMPSSWCW